MNKLKLALANALLVAAIVAPAGCRKAEVMTEADVLGTWEVKAWTWTEPAYYKSYDMLGTLEFIAHSYDGRPYPRVRFTFMHDGLQQIMEGSAALAGLPVITFECWFGSGFPDNLAFRGIVEEGRMLGYGGFYWDIMHYGSWEWEAVKK